MIKAEVAIYPSSNLSLASSSPKSFQFLDEFGLDHDFYYGSTSLNTTITGPTEQIWSALQRLFSESQADTQDVIMVVTITDESA